MPQLIIRYMHRCRLCARYFTAPLHTDETCLCGGDFLVDLTYHPNLQGRLDISAWSQFSDVEKEAYRRARMPADEVAAEEVAPTNGHHHELEDESHLRVVAG